MAVYLSAANDVVAVTNFVLSFPTWVGSRNELCQVLKSFPLAFESEQLFVIDRLRLGCEFQFL